MCYIYVFRRPKFICTQNKGYGSVFDYFRSPTMLRFLTQSDFRWSYCTVILHVRMMNMCICRAYRLVRILFYQDFFYSCFGTFRIFQLLVEVFPLHKLIWIWVNTVVIHSLNIAFSGPMDRKLRFFLQKLVENIVLLISALVDKFHCTIFIKIRT
jgi:hypothetical protein